MKNLSAGAYVLAACLFGASVASARVPMSNFAGWLGVAVAVPIVGLVIALIVPAFRKTTNVPRMMFRISLVVLLMNALRRMLTP